MSKRRVVITGIGMVTPLGITTNETWEALIAGKSGIKPITHFDASELPTKFAGTIRDFDMSAFLTGKDMRKMDPFIQYGIIAATEAIADSGIGEANADLTRVGVAIGSGIGGITYIEETCNKVVASGPRRVSPMFIPSIIINMVSGHISMRHGFQGPNLAYATACTTGTHSIGEAARIIAYGDADVMIAGGTEKSSTLVGMAGFSAARALSTRNDDPEAASRPWDKDRDGFVLGDGAGVLVLEELEHAKKRGAKIYAELAGYGRSACAYHITLPSPDGKGAMLAMQAAINDAQLNISDIQYINAHATSTLAGDEIENIAIKKLFKDHAYKLMVSATKSMTGHLLGAAGAIEAAFCVLAMQQSIVPPTINLDNPDEGCDLDYVPHTARQHTLNITLSNSFGFGGTNASLVFKTLT